MQIRRIIEKGIIWYAFTISHIIDLFHCFLWHENKQTIIAIKYYVCVWLTI